LKDNDNHLICYQLVQCQGFTGWSELRSRTNPESRRDQVGVNCFFLLGRNEHDPGIIKRMVGTLSAEFADGGKWNQGGKIVPLNFSLSATDERAWQALEEAKESATGFFGVRGIVFWIGYIFAGDLILLTLYRCLRALTYLPKIRRAMKRRNVCLRIDTRTGANVAGPSLALAACISAILAISTLPLKSGKKFLPRFISSLFSGLPGCAVTGELKRGRIEAVHGIEKKLLALRERPDIRRAIIPYGNRSEVSHVLGGSIVKAFIMPAETFEHQWLFTALWRLAPLRKTWLILNVGIVLMTIFLFLKLPDVVHSYLLPPIAIHSVLTGAGTFSMTHMATKGLLLRKTDHIEVQVAGHDLDGKADLIASCRRKNSTGTENQCLRIVGEGDWRSEVEMTLIDGTASFEFRNNGDGRNSCPELRLDVIHRGHRESSLLVHTVIADDGLK
jgi:hypothetical protein